MKSKTIIPIVIFLLTLFINTAHSQWTRTTGPAGDAVKAFAVSGSNIYAAASYGGVYISSNNGETWNEVRNGLPNEKVTCIAVEGNKVLVGTDGAGIFLSTNNGSSWNSKNNGLSQLYINTIQFIDSNIFVGSRGIYRSSDYGNSWITVFDQFVQVLCFTEKVDKFFGNKLIAGSSQGIYTSTDDGFSWTHVSFSGGTVFCFGVKDDKIYSSTYNHYISYPYDRYELSSSYDGESWNVEFTAPGQISSIVVKGNQVFAATSKGIIRSGNGWALEDNKLYNFNALIAKDNLLFAGNDIDGIMISSDNGLSWNIKNAGLNHQYIRNLVKNGNNMYASNITEGWNEELFHSSDNGASWNIAHRTIMFSNIFTMANIGNNLFISTRGYVESSDTIYRSTDNGYTWSALINELPKSYISFSCLAVDGNVLYCGGNELVNHTCIYRSTDLGESWSSIGFNLSNDRVTKLLVSGNNIFAGTGSHGIYRSTNNGLNWISPVGQANLYITSFAVSGNKIYAGSDNTVFITSNNGETWQASSILPTSFYQLSMPIAIVGEKILAGTGAGLFLSTNNGMSWRDKNEGITPSGQSVNCLLIDGDYILSGLGNQSLWKRAVEDATGIVNISNQVPDKFSLSQNYPNPFNPTTKIKFSLPQNSFVTLKVYNSIGKEVGNLVNENMTSGSYEYEFNGEALSSGIYFYKLETGKFTETKKMILLK